MKRGKKYQAVAGKVDRTKTYSIPEAVNLLREVKWANFDESVNLDLKLTVDPRRADQQIRGTVVLPHGTGKKIRVCVFVKGEKAREATEAGADYVGGDELVEKVQGGWTDFEAAISTPDMMKSVGKLGKVLGPRGLMPNPKTGTVTFDLAQAINQIKGGRVEYRLDRLANMHVLVGKTSFNNEQLVDNVTTLVDAVIKAKPSSARGQFIKSITLSSTMSPGIRIDITPAKAE
ncbi:MAG TPA: 50S ribosomal protein L1 [Candidatus Sumerlaeota bacterium]|nr:MAG: 50S ribosomal protein L1 [candidate division BRC1 bacterium ADurb.Bin183]HOE64826.1 50S ribosomal protein L1 [Candidatus Sumerlaeota bacterium]HRR30825.1 50S ribosomal protein L1 [Candidatus Sumerlaeia bacterium]HON50963.1 50S ribosomal protein L1 [Candidatus Sumerlaeota bacterium]HOR65657.1 50S ribosomal protein L1 [Candidatus Sumerlaeota bacterium]